MLVTGDAAAGMAGGVVAEVAAPAACDADVVAEVTVLVTGDAAVGVAGGGEVAEVAEPVAVAAEGAGAPAGAGVVAELDSLVAAAVACAADVTAEVTVLVTEEPAGAVAGGVAACACRENTSKTTRIPAARIAACATRRAARRKTSCGISGSAQGGLDQTLLPIISQPKPARAPFFNF